MESKEYFEKIMQDYNQNGKGRSLRKGCNGKFLKPEFQEARKSHCISKETLMLLMTTAMQTRLSI